MTKIILTPDNSIGTIQKALDTRGALIVFSPGIYHIDKMVFTNDGQKIISHDATIQMGGPINHLFMTRVYKNTTAYNGVHDLTIEGLTFEGMGKYKTPLNLLTLWHAENVTIRNCTFLDAYHFHAVEINGCKNVLIEGCKFLGYNSDKKNDFREPIQIDFSSASDIFLFEEGSKCYDGVCCMDITIRNCIFDKSESRPGPSSCIGNHAQPYGKTHKRIILEDLKMKGYGTNPDAAAIKLIGMDDVKCRNITADGFGRLAMIYAAGYSYNKGLNKVKRGTNDGQCNNLLFEDCTAINPTGNVVAHGIYTSKNYVNHKGITKTRCRIVRE